MPEALFPFQKLGAEFLAQRRIALLADEMGLGKSAQAIHAADIINAQNILILCPASLRTNWIHEFKKFSTHDRPTTALYDSNSTPGSGIVTCSYDLTLRPEIHSKLSAVKWDLLCLDEAHYLTGVGAQRTKTVLGKEGLAHTAQRIWFLSGTPMRNHPGELWVMLYVAGLTKLSKEDFETQYCKIERKEVRRGSRTFWQTKITGANPSSVPDLKAMMAPILFRRKKLEVLPDMPPITVSEVTVPANPVDEEIYFHKEWRLRQSIAEMTRAQWEGMGVTDQTTDDEVVAMLDGLQTQLKLSRQYIGLQKVDGVVEMAREILTQESKLVIFAWHASVMKAIAHALEKDYGAELIYGGTSPEKRDRLVKKFQEAKWRCRVLVGQVLAAGTGITLTAARRALVVEPSWVPAENSQAVMRIHRIGQRDPCLVQYVMLDNNPVENRVMKALVRKTQDFVNIFG